MKNFNIMGIHGKIQFLGEGGFTKNQYIGGNCLKRELGQFADLRVMCIMCHIRVVLFFGMIKRKVFTSNIYVFFHKNVFSLCVLNLGTQIRCAQNQHTAVQMDLK